MNRRAGAELERSSRPRGRSKKAYARLGYLAINMDGQKMRFRSYGHAHRGHLYLFECNFDRARLRIFPSAATGRAWFRKGAISPLERALGQPGGRNASCNDLVSLPHKRPLRTTPPPPPTFSHCDGGKLSTATAA